MYVGRVVGRSEEVCLALLLLLQQGYLEIHRCFSARHPAVRSDVFLRRCHLAYA